MNANERRPMTTAEADIFMTKMYALENMFDGISEEFAQMPEGIGAAFNLAYYDGLTAQEILDLKFEDIDFDKCIITIRGRMADGEERWEAAPWVTSFLERIQLHRDADLNEWAVTTGCSRTPAMLDSLVETVLKNHGIYNVGLAELKDFHDIKEGFYWYRQG